MPCPPACCSSALLLWRRVNADGLAIGLVLVGALILIALTETMIVRDIYDQDYARANTMFKLSFRAQNLLIMAALACCLAPAVARGEVWMTAALAAAVPWWQRWPMRHMFPAAVGRPLSGRAGLSGRRARAGRGRGPPVAGPGRVADRGLRRCLWRHRARLCDDRLAGRSGWAGHEWLWRNDATAALARADRVRVFFTTADPVARCAVIRLFSIRYVILGQIEMLQYPDLQTPAILALGPVIHDDAGGRIVQIARDQCP